MISLEEAQRLMDSLPLNSNSESVSISNACGRVLWEDVVARVDSPGFDNAAVDGYALGQLCAEGELSVVGNSFAGAPYSGDELPIGSAVKILTGGVVPEGTERVVMWEDCAREDDRLSVRDFGTPGQHIRKQGEDFEAGAIVARQGAIVSPAMIGLLASAGAADVAVAIPPRIGLLITGDELKDVGSGLDFGQIYNSNSPALVAALIEVGISQIEVLHVRDDYLSTLKALTGLTERNDIVVTVGGLADGDRDFILPALRAMGGTEVFSRVAIKPGKPVSCFASGNTPVICLPGNPVSALVTGFLFVRRIVLRWLGAKAIEDWVTALLSDDLKKKPGRAEFVPGVIREGVFVPVEQRGSHLLQTLARSTHLGYLESSTAKCNIGELIQALRMEWRMPS